MNNVQIADFKHLYDLSDLLTPSGFWSDVLKSRAKINEQYGEKLLCWSKDAQRRLEKMNLDADAGSQIVHRFLNSFLTSTREEAYAVLSAAQDLSAAGGPLRAFQQSTNDVQGKHERLSRDLDSLMKDHKECIKTLQDLKETGLKAMAATSNYQDRINKIQVDLDNGGKVHGKSNQAQRRNVRALEARLGKQIELEQSSRAKYEDLLKTERDLISTLKKTSDTACQEACDLRGSQIEGLVSLLRDFVVKLNPTSSAKSERAQPLVEILDDITANLGNIVNSTFDDHSRRYYFPDVKAWHRKLGFLEKLPTPVIRESDLLLSRKPTKGLTAELQLIQQAVSFVAPTLPDRQPWVRRSGSAAPTIEEGNLNNNKHNNIADTVCPKVRYLDEVYVRAVYPFKATHPEHLPLTPGLQVKQKFPADIRGMAFGWSRTRYGGPKKYGYYPADLVILDE